MSNPDSDADKKPTVTKMRTGGPARGNESPSHIFGEMRHDPEQIKKLFREGTYPYKTRIRRASYEQHKQELQVELLYPTCSR